MKIIIFDSPGNKTFVLINLGKYQILLNRTYKFNNLGRYFVHLNSNRKVCFVKEIFEFYR